MCIICIELEKQRITPFEAFRNLREVEMDDKHREELTTRLLDEITVDLGDEDPEIPLL